MCSSSSPLPEAGARAATRAEILFRDTSRRRAPLGVARLQRMLLLLLAAPATAQVGSAAPSLPPTFITDGEGQRNLLIVVLAAIGSAIGGALFVFTLVAPIMAMGPRPARTAHKSEDQASTCTRYLHNDGTGEFNRLESIRTSESSVPGMIVEMGKPSEGPHRAGADAGRPVERLGGSPRAGKLANGEDIHYS